MEHGTIVEYIDQQRIFCAVVVEYKDPRVRLLNENNGEVNQKASRLSHISRMRLKLNGGRDKLIATIKETAVRRKSLSEMIDIRELWEVLSPMGEWVDLATMTALCFLNDAAATEIYTEAREKPTFSDPELEGAITEVFVADDPDAVYAPS